MDDEDDDDGDGALADTLVACSAHMDTDNAGGGRELADVRWLEHGFGSHYYASWKRQPQATCVA